MTDTAPAAKPRAFVEYRSDDPGEVSLPGYLNPSPTIVEPGDVFSVDSDQLDALLSRGRFEKADEPATDASPNEGLTKAKLVDKLEAAGYEPAPSHTKAELVELADELDRTTPTPSGPDGENPNTEGPTA